MTRGTFLYTGAAAVACVAMGMPRRAAAPAVSRWARQHGGKAILIDEVWSVQLPAVGMAPAFAELAQVADGQLIASGSMIRGHFGGQPLQIEVQCLA